MSRSWLLGVGVFVLSLATGCHGSWPLCCRGSACGPPGYSTPTYTVPPAIGPAPTYVPGTPGGAVYTAPPAATGVPAYQGSGSR